MLEVPVKKKKRTLQETKIRKKCLTMGEREMFFKFLCKFNPSAITFCLHTQFLSVVSKPMHLNFIPVIVPNNSVHCTLAIHRLDLHDTKLSCISHIATTKFCHCRWIICMIYRHEEKIDFLQTPSDPCFCSCFQLATFLLLSPDCKQWHNDETRFLRVVPRYNSLLQNRVF